MLDNFTIYVIEIYLIATSNDQQIFNSLYTEIHSARFKIANNLKAICFIVMINAFI